MRFKQFKNEMITERKKYLIELFVKKCTVLDVIKSHMAFHINLIEKSYNANTEDIERIREYCSINNYILKISPIIDETFTEAELEESIKFFSKGAGKKMIDPSFLLKVGKISENIILEAEQEFILKKT
jgi:hypothetical protein